VKIPLNLKGNFLSNNEKTNDVVCDRVLGVKNQQEDKASIVKMMMLHWMCGKT